MNYTSEPKNIYLADDDDDDCLLFKSALESINHHTELTIINNGVELMDTLDENVPPPPYAIFLDLNMPRKNGFESLAEIRETSKLKDIPVIIFSTSSNTETIDRTFSLGANYYICKPSSYSGLTKSIEKVLSLTTQQLTNQPDRNQFVLLA